MFYPLVYSYRVELPVARTSRSRQCRQAGREFAQCLSNGPCHATLLSLWDIHSLLLPQLRRSSSQVVNPRPLWKVAQPLDLKRPDKVKHKRFP